MSHSDSAKTVDFYVDASINAERALNYPDSAQNEDPGVPSFSDATSALDWINTNHPSIVEAQHTAAELGRHEAVWTLAGVLTEFHHRRGRLNELLPVWETALTSAEHLPDSVSRTITAYTLLGDTYSITKDFDKSDEYLNKALALAEHHEDLNAQAHTHYAMGITEERRKDDDAAENHFTRSFELFHSIGDEVWEATALDAVGCYEAEHHKYDKAREHCERALALHRKHNNPVGEARALESLASIGQLVGNHQAVKYYCQALELFRNIDHMYGISDSLTRLGKAYSALNQKDAAREAWEEALKLYEAQKRTEAAERVQKKLNELD